MTIALLDTKCCGKDCNNAVTDICDDCEHGFCEECIGMDAESVQRCDACAKKAKSQAEGEGDD